MLKRYPVNILYIRLLKDGRVTRIERLDIEEGLSLVLFPADNSGFLWGESCHDFDKESTRAKINQSEIRDSILRELLAGKPMQAIVEVYEPYGDGQYWFCRRNVPSLPEEFSAKTFRIVEYQ